MGSSAKYFVILSYFLKGKQRVWVIFVHYPVFAKREGDLEPGQDQEQQCGQVHGGAGSAPL